MSEWKQYHIQQQMELQRTGWIGAWDALVSAVTRKPRIAITQPVTISFWAKGSGDIQFNGIQAETCIEAPQPSPPPAALVPDEGDAINRGDIIRMAQEAGLVRFEGGELEAYGIAKASFDDHSRAYWQVATEQRLKHFAALVQERVVHGDNK